MKKIKLILLSITLMVYAGSVRAAAPTNYEGFGAVTRGALDAPGGYEVYHVTSLDDDLGEYISAEYRGVPGQLRHALMERNADNRHIVFDVAGTITLNAHIYMRYDYVTLDGSSAPYPGITIDQGGDYQWYIAPWTPSEQHDIIINNIRFIGPGKDGSMDTAAITSLNGNYIYNVVVDHCAMTTIGDGVDITGNVSDVTYSWNLIYNNPMASLIAGWASKNGGPVRNVSFHHNVFAKNEERQLLVYQDIDMLDFVNNVVYGWDFCGGMRINYTEEGPNPKFNMENNYYYMWPNGFYDMPDHAVVFYGGLDEKCTYYFSGNILPDGEKDAVSTGERLPIPAWAEVTKYGANTLGDTVVPYAGTHYPTPEEHDLLNEVSRAIGGQGVPGPDPGPGPDPDPDPEPPIEPEDIPTKTEMKCYNNVINPSKGAEATISIALDKQTRVTIVIYDNKGIEIKKMVDEEKQPGFYSILWNGKDSSGNTVGSGIYMVHMKAGGYTETKKIGVVK